ncbi:MAG: type II toxin-antitoxin system RelE/ParE family toxin [Candidatus Dormiibacterota bacterium]
MTSRSPTRSVGRSTRPSPTPAPASRGKRPGGSCSLTEPSYRVELRPEAQKSLRRLGRGDRERLARAIDGLPEGDVKRLAGSVGLWRLRVGDWRVVYRRDEADRVITVVTVSPRGGAYKP